MREIKFRAWDKENEKMMKVSSLSLENKEIEPVMQDQRVGQKILKFWETFMKILNYWRKTNE